MKTHTSVYIAAALGLLLLVGCGPKGPVHRPLLQTPQNVGGEYSLTDLLFFDATMAFYLDKSAMEQSAVYRIISESGEDWSEAFDRLSSQLKDEAEDSDDPGDTRTSALIERIRWAAAFSGKKRGQDEPPFVAFVSADYTNGEARHLVGLLSTDADDVNLPGLKNDEPGAEQLPANQDPPKRIRTQQHEGFKFFYTDTVAITQLQKGLWVLATKPELKKVVDRIGGQAGKEKFTIPYEDAFRNFDHQLMFAATGLSEKSSKSSNDKEVPVDENKGEKATEEKAFDEIDGIYLGVNLAKGLEIETIVTPRKDLKESEKAELKAQIDEWLEDASNDRHVIVFGLHRYLETTQVTQDEDGIKLHLSMDQNQAHLLWGRMSGVIASGIVVSEYILGATRILPLLLPFLMSK